MTNQVFNQAEAEALGWRFELDDPATSMATKDEQTLSFTGGPKLFLLLAAIAEREGLGFLAGFGGSEAMTPELVGAVSGETYVAPTPAAPEPPPLEDRLLAALDTLDPNTATAADAIAALKSAIAAG